jgi:hypothetical protein
MAWPDLTTFAAVGGLVFGAGGLILSIWTRIEQSREYRVKRDARKPHCEVFASPHADNNGWRPLKFTFYNPSETAFIIETVETTTVGVSIAPVKDAGVGNIGYSGEGREPDISKAGHSAGAGWTVEAGTDAASPTQMLFWRPTSNPRSFSIRVTAREISAKRRKFHMQAEAAVNTATP